MHTMKLVTPAEMQRIDRITIEQRGTPGLELMKRAGAAVARDVLERFQPESAAIVVGKGNNGGDGFVVARVLHESGVRVELFLIFDPAEAKGDARTAMEEVPAEIPQTRVETAHALAARLHEFEVVVDAMLGTGLSGPARGLAKDVIAAVNRAMVNVVAVDVPSGLVGEGPQPEGALCVQAHVTVTIGLPKIGLILGEGSRRAGIVSIAAIGFPRDLLESDELQVNLLTEDGVASALPRRDPEGHKGTFGRVAVLGGAEGMTGAAILTARAASRSGAGLIYSVYPRELGPIFETTLIEPVKRPLPGKERWFTHAMVEAALEGVSDCGAVAFGPGVGQREATATFAAEIVGKIEVPLVIDADGLNVLAGNIEPLRRRQAATVLTPHPGEAARLLNSSVRDVQANRLEACLKLSKDLNAVILLKGAHSIVTAPGGQRYVNPTGNSGLAKGGSGDVLTGLILGLLGQGMDPVEAAATGAFVHGLAADLAAGDQSVRSITPGDVVDHFGKAFARLEKTARESHPVQY